MEPSEAGKQGPPREPSEAGKQGTPREPSEAGPVGKRRAEGAERSFCREAETEQSGLWPDAGEEEQGSGAQFLPPGGNGAERTLLRRIFRRGLLY